MPTSRVRRRGVLAAAGIGAAGLLAGCTGNDDDNPQNSQTDRGDDINAPADPPDEATLYREKIDSVPLIRAFGLDAGAGPGAEEVGQGSGFVFDERYVITNEHVITGADEVDLQYAVGEWSAARIVGTDVRSDLAVLEPEYVPSAATSFAFTDAIPVVGTGVKAIGNPLGLEGSLSTGVISGVDRAIFSEMTGVSIPHAVQTDAAINPGNSGGPLIDEDGDVVGVISAGGGENIGFAISAALSQRVVPALIADGRFEHAYLGADVVPMDPVVAGANDRAEPEGVLVIQLEPGSPGADVLRSSEDIVERHGAPIPVGGDVLVEMDGTPVGNAEQVNKFLVLEASPGDSVELTIDREGQTEMVAVTLDARPRPSPG